MFQVMCQNLLRRHKAFSVSLDLGAYGAKSRSEVSFICHVAVQKTCRAVHNLPARGLPRAAG